MIRCIIVVLTGLINDYIMLETQHEKDYKKNFFGMLTILVMILCAVFVVKFFSELRTYTVGSNNLKTITLSGHGEVQAVPDIAQIYFTMTKEAKTVKEAQDMVAELEKSALSKIKESGVEDKDIKTTDSSFYPKYEYQTAGGSRLACNQWGCPPSAGKQVIVGYVVNESITVKVRDTDNAGKIVEDLGAIGVSNLSGPNFTIDDEEDLKMEARKLAIENAQEKAKVLAKDLGVRLGRVSSFSEDGGYYPPVMYAAKAELQSADSSAGNAAVLPKGENTISSNVTVSYEIR